MAFFAAISSVKIVSLMLMSAVGASQLLDSGQDRMPLHQRQKRSRPYVADAAANKSVCHKGVRMCDKQRRTSMVEVRGRKIYTEKQQGGYYFSV